VNKLIALIALINAVPKDRWIHYGGSVVLFAFFRHVLPLLPSSMLTGVGAWAVAHTKLTSFVLASLAHVLKKLNDYRKGSRDWSDLTQDTLFGTAGAFNALLCAI
jgi:hypothetical protein